MAPDHLDPRPIVVEGDVVLSGCAGHRSAWKLYLSKPATIDGIFRSHVAGIWSFAILPPCFLLDAIMIRAVVALLIWMLLPAVAAAQAEKRVALVIGNSAYQHSPRLINPKNDATDIAAALKKLGFRVIEGFDLDKAASDRKVRDFAAALQGAEVGLFFFAGHGLQVAGQNYLVPVDAELKTASALDFEMVRVDVVQRAMEHETSTNVLFLDACRDNPLARNLARAMGTRSSEIGRGFAPVVSGVGTLVSFSTQPGNVALDGTGRNSPFAGALVKYLVTPKDDLSAILIDVRNDVMKETQNKQVPWEHSALRGRFYFNPAAQTAPSPQVAPARLSEAAEAWGAAERTTSVTALEAFIARYKDTFYAELARARIEELNKQKVAIAPPPQAKPADKAAPSPSCNGVETLVGDEKRCLRPGSGNWFKDCSECPLMVVVPAGSFMMGSPATEPERESWQNGTESPQLKVRISRPFAVGKFAITFDEWDACVAGGGCNGYRPADQDWGRGKRPVINVNWNDGKAYASWLSSKTGKSYRLLSEAEREYVTRAGTTTPFWWGSSISPTQVNYHGHATPYQGGGSKGEYRARTVPVDSFAANPWGLYNVHGNVWEWTEDCWNDNHSGNPGNGSARTSGDCGRRVLRGGSWVDIPLYLRSAYRNWNSADYRGYIIGFRLARTLGP